MIVRCHTDNRVIGCKKTTYAEGIKARSLPVMLLGWRRGYSLLDCFALGSGHICYLLERRLWH